SQGPGARLANGRRTRQRRVAPSHGISRSPALLGPLPLIPLPSPTPTYPPPRTPPSLVSSPPPPPGQRGKKKLFAVRQNHFPTYPSPYPSAVKGRTWIPSPSQVGKYNKQRNTRTPNLHSLPARHFLEHPICIHCSASSAWKTAETMKKEMMGSMEDELFPSTPGKVKIERTHAINRQLHQCFASTSTMFLWALFLIALTASYLSFQSFVDSSSRYFDASWGGMQWEKQIRASATVRRPGGFSVLVTGAAGFVGTHVSIALRKRGDGVVGLDNFNSYYDPSLKKARVALLDSRGVFVVEGDINDARLLAKLFDVVPFTHVMHLAAQAGVRYAIENPASYVHSNIAGLVALLEACKSADPQPAVVWASSSSVYGLNEKVPFSESDRTDRPASLYAATKKAGEEITHTYNHIYGLSTTGLRFFTVYGPWGRPDMAYFSFTRNILQGKPITVYRGKDRVDLARDFTYIDDIVKGCV
ncbi:unnamed protein product, partial [Musa hybrid cultivar]